MASSDGSSIDPPLFGKPRWLGFCHDGYPVVPLAQYLKLREKDPYNTQGRDPNLRARVMAAREQSLLTFGLLEAITDQHVPERTLITNESGQPVMTKNGLRRLIEGFTARIQGMQQEERELCADRLFTTLAEMHSRLTQHKELDFRIFKPLGSDVASMVCFIASLGEALLMCGAKWMRRKGFTWLWILIPSFRASLENLMTSDGWCPSIVNYLISVTSISTLEYAHLCGPAKDGKSHAKCSTESCATYVIDEKTYTQKHTPQCESAPRMACPHTAPPFHDVSQLLAQDEIPVITLGGGFDGRSAEFQVKNAANAPYVAISHVWADGLGSSTETGLPTCQLRRIASLVSQIMPGAAFWMDSLCIPETKNLRKKAIGLMSRTYGEAEAVLVLDRGMQLCHSADEPALNMLRVRTSGWMQRLWTLQEAVLSKELYFSLSDNLLPLSQLLDSAKDLWLLRHTTELAMELVRLGKGRAGLYSLADVSRSLRWRTTNRPSDETLAIASLLGVSASILVNLPEEERMIRMLQEIGRFPRNILYLHARKLQVPGFRWAPASFMSAHGSVSGGIYLSVASPDATLTTRGLEGIQYGVSFGKTTFENGQGWKLKDQRTGHLYVLIDPYDEPGSYECDMLLLEDCMPNWSSVPCVAVLKIQGRLENARQGLSLPLYCDYKRRLVLRHLELRGESDVTSTTSMKVNVCVG